MIANFFDPGLVVGVLLRLGMLNFGKYLRRIKALKQTTTDSVIFKIVEA